MASSLFLASEGLGALPGFLSERARGPRAAFVSTAANRLGEPDWVGRVRAELAGMGLALSDLDIEGMEPQQTRAALEGCDVIAVSGGDPFHLERCARASGFGPAVRAALDAGAVYVGQSAGAIVAGPDLRPIALTSPFEPAPDQPLAGLALARVVVLPHDDRPGRAERNRRALKAYGEELRLVALADDQALAIVDGREELMLSPGARAGDPPAPPERG